MHRLFRSYKCYSGNLLFFGRFREYIFEQLRKGSRCQFYFCCVFVYIADVCLFIVYQLFFFLYSKNQTLTLQKLLQFFSLNLLACDCPLLLLFLIGLFLYHFIVDAICFLLSSNYYILLWFLLRQNILSYL